MEVKASDLRIGNWVKIKSRYVEVESVDENGINIEISGGWYGSPERDYDGVFQDSSHAKWLSSNAYIVEPIVLSPEILEKAGFKKHSYECDEYTKGKLCIMDWGNGFILSNSFSFDLRIEIKYLHRLQNLFWDLTGTELIITI